MRKKCFRIGHLTRIAAVTVVLLLLTVSASAFSAGAAEEINEAGDNMYFWPLDYNADDVISGKSFYFETFDDYTDGAYPGSVAFDSTVSGAGYTDPITADVNAFTVAAWINIPSENSTEWNCIFSSGELSRSDFIELYYHKGTTGTEIRGSVGNFLDMYFNSGFEDYDSWHHIVYGGYRRGDE